VLVPELEELCDVLIVLVVLPLEVAAAELDAPPFFPEQPVAATSIARPTALEGAERSRRNHGCTIMDPPWSASCGFATRSPRIDARAWEGSIGMSKGIARDEDAASSAP
jgi:hypothetical protein